MHIVYISMKIIICIVLCIRFTVRILLASTSYTLLCCCCCCDIGHRDPASFAIILRVLATTTSSMNTSVSVWRAGTWDCCICTVWILAISYLYA